MESAQNLAGHLKPFHAAVGFGALDHAHDVRTINGAAIGDGGHHHRRLQRGDDQRTLPDGDGNRFAWIPLPMLFMTVMTEWCAAQKQSNVKL